MVRTIDQLFAGTFKNKTILITGDTGFKGSWLSIWLKEMGAFVYGYALPPVSQDDNFIKCGLYSHISHYDGDIRSLDDLKGCFMKVKPDIAIHLAAQAIVLDSYNQPHYTFETNMMGVVNFFEAVRESPSVKVAVNITSDKCYQNNEWLWGYKENDPMGGKDPYSASKGCSELITQSYISSFFTINNKCHIASARAGNVIGAGDWAPYRIVPDFFRAFKENKKLIIRNPDSIRPWQHVLEPLSGYLLLTAMLWNYGQIYSGGWNFGPVETNNYSVRSLIEKIISIAGNGGYEIPPAVKLPHESKLLKLDISKANALLKWKPVLNFNETVEFTANGYLDELSGRSDIYSCRVSELKKYIQLASERELVWASGGALETI
jgi:CDP-glucose 4,6-dehydratase